MHPLSRWHRLAFLRALRENAIIQMWKHYRIYFFWTLVFQQFRLFPGWSCNHLQEYCLNLNWTAKKLQTSTSKKRKSHVCKQGQCKILTGNRKKIRSNVSDPKGVSWFNPTWQLSTTQLCSVTPHCSRMMGIIGEKKVRKQVGWAKSSLMGQKMKINWCVMQLPTTQWTMPSQFPRSSPWPSFSTVYVLSILPQSMEYPHGQFGSPVLAVPLPGFLYPFSFRRSWKVLDFGWAWLSKN